MFNIAQEIIKTSMFNIAQNALTNQLHCYSLVRISLDTQ